MTQFMGVRESGDFCLGFVLLCLYFIDSKKSKRATDRRTGIKFDLSVTIAIVDDCNLRSMPSEGTFNCFLRK